MFDGCSRKLTSSYIVTSSGRSVKTVGRERTYVYADLYLGVFAANQIALRSLNGGISAFFDCINARVSNGFLRKSRLLRAFVRGEEVQGSMYSDVPPDRTMCFCSLSFPLLHLRSHSSFEGYIRKSVNTQSSVFRPSHLYHIVKGTNYLLVNLPVNCWSGKSQKLAA